MSDVKDEEVRSVWLGKRYISIGTTRVKGNEMHFKRIGGMPLFNQYVPVLANAKEIPYQEREIWIPGVGASGIKLRLFMADLRLDKYFAMINPQDLNAISHLKKENEALHLEIERLFEMLYDVSNEDRWKKRIKKEVENYNAIKGFGYGGNSSYGFGGGQPGFGGGFGGQPPDGGGEM